MIGYEYGFLGVGEIATAMVTGLCDAADGAPRILLSPRNRDRSAALAARFPTVSVAADNQVVIDGCAVLVLAIRPQDARASLDGLRFRPDQAIVSVIAGMPRSAVAPLVAPADDIARAIPMPAVARRAGVTPIHPASEAAQALFRRLGEAIGVDDLTVFEAMSAATATVAAQLEYLAQISQWLGTQGVPREEASRYVTSIFVGLAETLDEGGGDLGQLVRAHATPGGINERFREMLAEAGVFDAVARSLQTIHAGLRAGLTQQGDDG